MTAGLPSPELAGQRPAAVCVRGATYIAQESLVFSHFIWGHFYPVFVAVSKAGFLHRATRLTFVAEPFLCPRSRFLPRFFLIFISTFGY